MVTEVPLRIQTLRKRSGMSIRQLAKIAGVAPGIVSCLERGKNSPNLVTLQKILSALGTDFATFFAEGTKKSKKGPVFRREKMHTISDGDRTYTITFDKRPEIQVEILDEQFRSSRKRPPFETLECDVAGYVLSGNLILEIKNKPAETLRPGDAFYICKGAMHRGFAAKGESVRLITACYPVRY